MLEVGVGDPWNGRHAASQLLRDLDAAVDDANPDTLEPRVIVVAAGSRYEGALALFPANRNAAGQIVAAGSLTALEKLAEDPPTRARVRALGVAGAFHTRYMASALDDYAAAAAGIATAEPTATLLSNRDGKPVTSAAAAMDALVAQLIQPVRWDLCTATLREHDVKAIVEFPPAGALAGIAKRELRGITTRAVKTPADLDALAEL